MQQQTSPDSSFFDLEGILYDREEEHQKLIEAFQRVVSSSTTNNHKSEFILLSGKSGTGKTALAQKLRTHVMSQDGFFVTGKFDQLQKSDPYAALVSAFTEYFTLLTNNTDINRRYKVESNIRTRLHADLQILIDMIPAIGIVLGDSSQKQAISNLRGAESNTRLRVATRNLMRIICSPEKPLVFFLDDLQWADLGSLDLLEAIASDSANCKRLVILGACRYNEVAFEDDFASFLRNLEVSQKATVTPIILHNLRPNAVGKLISDLLKLPLNRIKPLARVVYRKTHGNILFVKQTLESLCKDHILYYNEENNGGQWRWHTNSLLKWEEGTHNVEMMLQHKIRCLPPEVQTVLKTGACLGSEINAYVLSKAVEPSLNYIHCINYAVEQKLVTISQDHEWFDYKFVHDRVQQAAYDLIPPEDKPEFHLAIGRRLRSTMSVENIEIHIFLTVNQISRGLKILKDQDEKDDISKLYLRAGQRAIRCSDFKEAASYFTLGINLLSERKWRDQFYLSLDLFNAVAEATYCSGEFDKTDRYVDEILSNTRYDKDKMHAYSTKIYALGARQKLKEAIDLGLHVLEKLGEKIPSEGSKATVLHDVCKTKWMLLGKTDESIVDLPTMCDTDKIAAMSILNLLTTYVFVSRMEIFPFIPCRMVQLTVRYGVCAISAFGFSTLGLVLIKLEQFRESCRMVQLGLDLLNRFKIREWIPRVHVLSYGHHGPLQKRLKSLEEPLQNGIQVALETGDIEYSAIGMHRLTHIKFFTGNPLLELERSIRQNMKFMSEYKQELPLAAEVLVLQTVHNLMGFSDDPLVLTGEVMHEETTLKEAHSNNNFNVPFKIMLWKVFLAFIMNEFHQAAEFAESYRTFTKRPGLSGEYLQQCFYNGLLSLELARHDPGRYGMCRRKHLANARKSLKCMQKMAQHCPENFLNRIFLFKAEFASLKGNLDHAIPMYQRAIAIAETEGILHEQALAYERAGLALRHRKENGTTSIAFLEQACKLYHQWGAHAKVEQMKKKYSIRKNILD